MGKINRAPELPLGSIKVAHEGMLKCGDRSECRAPHEGRRQLRCQFESDLRNGEGKPGDCRFRGRDGRSTLLHPFHWAQSARCAEFFFSRMCRKRENENAGACSSERPLALADSKFEDLTTFGKCYDARTALIYFKETGIASVCFLVVPQGPLSLPFGATMQHFPEIQLTFQEARVLGCLLEKEILTPDSYPLTPNSLLLACNQTTSRDPVTRFTGDEVAEALRGLSEKYLVEKNLGGRAPKFEHCIQDVLSMQRSERAVLTVLLLRGPQSAGEIRQRTDRLHTFSSLEEVEETLTWFIDYPHGPLVRRIPVGEGRRVETFVHLLSPAAADGFSVTVTPSAAADTPAENDWRAAIEARLASLEAEIAELKAGQTPRSVDGNP
ncbi:MAG: DUF480 domain-containing protein [Verrucomicrobiaceae bacterium]|nr:MAG: DUF480 domain-containing protein [Verrucomicrobiaceae bacterium]